MGQTVPRGSYMLSELWPYMREQEFFLLIILQRFAKFTLAISDNLCSKIGTHDFIECIYRVYALQVTGDIEYNGENLNKFVPAKTSAYVSQHDLHVPEMTVRETLDFSARFQGVGWRAGICEAFDSTRRVKAVNIIHYQKNHVNR